MLDALPDISREVRRQHDAAVEARLKALVDSGVPVETLSLQYSYSKPATTTIMYKGQPVAEFKIVYHVDPEEL